MASSEILMQLTCDVAPIKRITWGDVKKSLKGGTRRTCFYCRTIQYETICGCCGAPET